MMVTQVLLCFNRFYGANTRRTFVVVHFFPLEISQSSRAILMTAERDRLWAFINRNGNPLEFANEDAAGKR
jgi:hypothetical protein